jgi:cytochrome P450
MGGACRGVDPHGRLARRAQEPTGDEPGMAATDQVTFEFDPFDPRFWDDPYPYYREMRERHPVYYGGDPSCFMISRYADIEPAMSDWRTFSSARGVLVGTDSSQLPTNMFNMDPPRHDQLRSVLTRVLTPSRVASLEPFVRELARGLIAQFREDGAADVTTQYAQVIPSTVVGELMGLNRDDREKFLAWNLATVGSQDFVGPEALQAYAEMDAYWRETIASRRGQRTDDVVSEIFHAQIEGENLTDEEIYGFCSLILPASQHTTINMMSNAVISLARAPDQRQLLRQDPILWPEALEELIRYESPVQGLARTATRDVELHGVTIPEGEWVLMLFASANHDERVYDDPDRLDVTRKNVRPHYSFGHGIHYCLGNAVARLQTRVALQELVDALGEWDVDEDGIVRNQLVPGRGVAHTPIVFAPSMS